MPVTVVIFEYDRSSPDLIYKAVMLIVAMIDCTLENSNDVITRFRLEHDKNSTMQACIIRRFPRLPDSLIQEVRKQDAGS